jgi:F-type H+-transporting ATPase subunit b
MWKWGRPAARTMAAERHDQIKTALEEAATLRDAAAAKLAEYEERLKKSDDEIKAMVDAIRASAESDKARILENAERASLQMKKDAETRIAAEIQNARAMLTREVTAAAATATEKLLRDKLMPSDQQKLVGSFITDLGTATPSFGEKR